jgi:adenylate cyclase
VRTQTRIPDRARGLDRHPRLIEAAKALRELLPGDSRFGDPLSTAGSEQAQLVARRLTALTAERPGVMREAGLSALQVWQAISEAQGRGRGQRELTIVFTDLAGFSTWVLEVGDDTALELLRDVGEALEPPIARHGGEVVKRLGDGWMAVFEQPTHALAALGEASERLARVHAPGYQPRTHTGMHIGRPRKLGGDYLGVDVNIAARLAEKAAPGELLVSDRALADLDASALKIVRKRRFHVKGVPKDVQTFSVAVRR